MSAPKRLPSTPQAVKKDSVPRLIYADSERDPDMLYATGFFVPDAFLFLEKRLLKNRFLKKLARGVLLLQ
jgi:hypothetical protein